MNAEIILARLRRFLLLVAGALCAGTVIELWVTEHTQSPTQWIPFALCGLGLAMLLATLARPQRTVLLALRGSMAVVALGSLFGLYEHIEYNAAFYLEIHPNATSGDVVWGALSGANPLLAPCILALTALLAIAATYQHPALSRST